VGPFQIITSRSRWGQFRLAVRHAWRPGGRQRRRRSSRHCTVWRPAEARRARHGRRRTLLTRCGYLTITRGRARRPDGTRYFPLDEWLHLAPHHEASPWVRGRGCALDAEHPTGRRRGSFPPRWAPRRPPGDLVAGADLAVLSLLSRHAPAARAGTALAVSAVSGLALFVPGVLRWLPDRECQVRKYFMHAKGYTRAAFRWGIELGLRSVRSS